MAKSRKKKKYPDKKEEIAEHTGVAAAVGDAPQLTPLIVGEVAVGLTRVVEDLATCQAEEAAGKKKEWLRAHPARLEKGEAGHQRHQRQGGVGKFQSWRDMVVFHRLRTREK